ncbi:hypothetical protein KCP75_10120 [Salmonella enterica subsp. enterica]|nr:hypothetical protein KCP75_10120 [Salmonella enterica subsp. enterica]
MVANPANDFIHAFGGKYFCWLRVIFSRHVCFYACPLKRWWKVRVERAGIPPLPAIPLLTFAAQFILLQYVKDKTENWARTAREKYAMAVSVGKPISAIRGFYWRRHNQSASGFHLFQKVGKQRASRPPLFHCSFYFFFFLFVTRLRRYQQYFHRISSATSAHAHVQF